MMKSGKTFSRRRRLDAVLVGAAAAVLFALPNGAEALKGSLSTDSERVRSGEVVKLLITVAGDGAASSYEIEQPVLPKLEHLSPGAVRQRNEVVLGEGKERFSVSFLYLLTAGQPGEDKIPDIQIKYRRKGEDEGLVLNVKGLIIAVEEGGAGISAVVVCACLAVGAAAIGFIVRRRRRRAASTVSREESPGFEIGRPDACTVALGRVEQARRLKLAGERGSYCSEILSALQAYLEQEKEPEVKELTRRLDGLRERIKYAGDEDAEREIEEIARRVELFLKRKIREQLAE